MSFVKLNSLLFISIIIELILHLATNNGLKYYHSSVPRMFVISLNCAKTQMKCVQCKKISIDQTAERQKPYNLTLNARKAAKKSSKLLKEKKTSVYVCQDL